MFVLNLKWQPVSRLCPVQRLHMIPSDILLAVSAVSIVDIIALITTADLPLSILKWLQSAPCHGYVNPPLYNLPNLLPLSGCFGHGLFHIAHIVRSYQSGGWSFVAGFPSKDARAAEENTSSGSRLTVIILSAFWPVSPISRPMYSCVPVRAIRTFLQIKKPSPVSIWLAYGVTIVG